MAGKFNYIIEGKGFEKYNYMNVYLLEMDFKESHLNKQYGTIVIGK